MTTAELAPIILTVGGLLPLLTSVAQQPHWSDRQRTVVGVAISLLAGLVTYVATNDFNVDSPGKLVTVLVGVVLTSATSYKTVWKQAGVARAIEQATSPTPPPVPGRPADADAEIVEEVEENPLDEEPDEDEPDDLPMPDGFDDGSDPAKREQP